MPQGSFSCSCGAIHLQGAVSEADWGIVVLADFVSFVSVYTRKLTHFIARPLKIKASALILEESPIK